MQLRSTIPMILLWIAVVSSWAQTPYTLPADPTNRTAVPPSPEAWAFAKYGNYAVSRETGVPTISIPLYTVQQGDISVPINLTYHAAGIKVDEKASWVGLGWDLNIAGIISRTVKGYPDEYPVAGYLKHPVATAAGFEPYNESQFTTLNQIVAGEYDTQPDEFNLSLPGFSGKFFLNPDGTAVFQPLADIKIEYNSISNSAIEEFTVTTPDGIKYKFGQAAKTSYHTGYLLPQVVANSSWYLLEITSASGTGKVSFTYKWKPDMIPFQYRATETEYLVLHNKNIINGASGYQGYTRQTTQGSIDWTYTDSRIVESIIFDEGKVVLNSSNNRQDVTDLGLSSIDIFGADQVTKIKGFDFTYDYFTGSAVGAPNFENLRLKLVSVQERGKNNETLPPYQFTYLETGVYRLPPRYSYSQDYWGYYNNAINSTLLPVYNFSDPLIPALVIRMGGANRDAHATYMKAGILQKITYPTKGTTEFDFEANQFSRAYNKETTVENRPSATVYPPPGGGSVTGGQTDSKIIPTMSATKNAVITYNIMKAGTVDLLNGQMSVGVEDLTTSTQVFQNFVMTNAYLNQAVTLQANHSYRVWVSSTIDQATVKGVASIEVYWGETTYQNVTENTLVGGLRVKSIKNKDENGAQTSQKHYRYYTPTDTLKSSGSYNSLYTPTTKSFVQRTEMRGTLFETVGIYAGSCIGNYSDITISLTTDPSEQSGFPASNPVTYEYVTEFTESPLAPTNGKSVYQYAIAPDAFIPSLYSWNLDRSWRRGQLLNERHYDNGGTIRKEVMYNYETISTVKPDVYGLKVSKIWSISSNPLLPCVDQDCAGGCTPSEIHDQRMAMFLYTPYQQIIEWKRLLNITEVVDGVQTFTQFSYQPQNAHTNVLSKQVTNSDNKVSKVDLKYALETSNTAMSTRNMVGVALESKNYVGAQLIGGSRLTYATLNGNFIANKFEQQLSDQSYLDVGEILEVNQKGNPVIIKRKDGIYKTILWDLRGNQPILQTAGSQPSVNTSTINLTNNSASPGITTLREFVVPYGQTVSISTTVTDPTGAITGPTIYSFYIIREGATVEVYSHKMPGTQTQTLTLEPGRYFMKGQLNLGTSKTIITQASLPYKTLDLFYQGFEDGVGNSSSGDSKTGLKSKTDGFQCAVTGLTDTKSYQLTYWVKSSNVWTPQQTTVTPSSGSYTINLSGQIDEVRLYPLGSQISTYAYDPIDLSVKTVTDGNNQPMQFDYDNIGRLQSAKDVNLDILKSFEYKFKQ